MPPKWPRKPDRNDPDYRRLDDRMNFATHVAAFSAINSGLWFVNIVQLHGWTWTPWVTGSWAIALLVHGIYVFAIANYSNSPTSTPTKT